MTEKGVFELCANSSISDSGEILTMGPKRKEEKKSSENGNSFALNWQKTSWFSMRQGSAPESAQVRRFGWLERYPGRNGDF
jgi:hypothetical protein